MMASDLPVKENPSGRVSRTLPWCFCFFSCGVAFSIAAAHIALGLWLLVWFVSLYLKQTHLQRTPLDIPVLIFAGSELLSGVLGLDPGRSMGHLASLWHIVIYLLVVNTVPTRQWLMRGISVLFVTGGLNALYGMVQYFKEGFFFFREGQDMARWIDGPNRVLGTFSHSMTFSGQMTMLAILGVSFLVWNWRESHKKWILFPVLLTGGALVLSLVRSAWVGTFSGILLVGALAGKRVFGLLLVFLGTCILAGFLWVPSFDERLKTIVDPDFPSNRARINMAKASLEIFKEHPVFGVGGGNYRLVIAPLMEPYKLHNKSHPHNNLLAQVTEKGFTGLLAFLWIWFIFYKESLKAWCRAKEGFSKFLLGGGMAAIGGFHTFGMFESNFGDSEVAMMMWLIVGLALWGRSRLSAGETGLKTG